jgi:hypothetical protein
MPFSKYSPKQKKLARIAEPRDAITGADFAALKKKPKKMAGGGKLSSKKRGAVVSVKRKGSKLPVNVHRKSGQLMGSQKQFLEKMGYDDQPAPFKDFDEQEFKVKDIPTPKI